MLIGNNAKKFEKPKSGTYQAVLADVVDVGPVENKKYGKINNMVRLVWLLDANDKEGKPFRVMRQVNAIITVKPKKSNLYSIVADMIGKAPSIPYDVETLIGRNNMLVIKNVKSEDGQDEYANVVAIMEVEAGKALITVANDFERDYVRKAKAEKGQQASAATPAQAQQATPAQAQQATTPAQPAQTSAAATTQPAEVEDEDIPF